MWHGMIASGKTVVVRHVSKDEFLEDTSNFGPASEMLYNMYMAFDQSGCKCTDKSWWLLALICEIISDLVYGPKTSHVTTSERVAGIKPRTFSQIVQSWKGPLLSD